MTDPYGGIFTISIKIRYQITDIKKYICISIFESNSNFYSTVALELQLFSNLSFCSSYLIEVYDEFQNAWKRENNVVHETKGNKLEIIHQA